MNETILKDLQSCLHAEHRHLTAKAVAIEHSLSRSAASSLLESLPYYDTSKECAYEITRCILNKDDDKVVASLVTTIETIRKGDEKPHSNNSIHSISLSLPSNNGSESTIAAHMKTLSLVNDDPDIILDPELACDVIDPASVVEKLDKDSIRMNRFKKKSKGSKITESNNKPAAAQKSTQSRPKIVTKKKATSAATFFKSEKTKTVVSKKKQTMKTKKSVTEKVSVIKKDKPKTGNADDFVGDVDEDEEFLKGEEERKKRNAAKESKRSQEIKKRESDSRSQPKRIAMVDDSNGDDAESEGNKKAKHGAMDTFATKRDRVEEKPQQQGKKKRKQILEEKTFVDENGMFRTETVKVWKEVEEDVAAPVPATKKATSSSKPKPKAKSSKNMKQQGLMGFFGAKK